MLARFGRWISFSLVYCLMATGASADFSDEQCLSCHGDSAKVKSVVHPEEIGSSVHADNACVDCHTGITKLEHDERLPRVNCGECHDDVVEEFKESVHALTAIEDRSLRPGCTACHGTHAILSPKNRESPTHPAKVAEMCGNCHSNTEVMMRVGQRGFDPVAHYRESVHAEVRGGKTSRPAATCVDCHSAHTVFPPAHPKSTFGKFAIPQSCGRCHERERDEYLESIHWTSVKRHGGAYAPVCNDCHGEHGVRLRSGDDPQAVLSTVEICSNCHANKVMMGRFGLDSRRLESYQRTYHGMAVLRGSPDAASCVSCHEVHAIRSKSDPHSSVHAENLRNTCSRCHPTALAGFEKVSVHPVDQSERNPIAYLVRVAYVWLIAVVIGGMILHNIVILSYYVGEKHRRDSLQPRIQRFQRFEVIQHLLMFVSFTVLAVTGFALTFPEAGWVVWLAARGLDEEWRGLLHRFAAVILVIVSGVQLVYFIAYRSGRREIRELIPRASDLIGFVHNMMFHLRLSSRRPEFGRFDYTEKAEYLALIWGVAIMAATGFVLWFPEVFLQYLPTWAFEVAEEIHFYEAVLAVLAIVFWHLFFVIYHPEKYPMSTTWLDGKVTEDEQRHHHALEERAEGTKEESAEKGEA